MTGRIIGFDAATHKVAIGVLFVIAAVAATLSGCDPPHSGCSNDNCASDIAWNMQWFDAQHHVGVTGTATLDSKTGAQANLSLICWGGPAPSLKVGIGYANLDIKTEQQVHKVGGQTFWLNPFGPNTPAIPPSVYTTTSQSVDVATMLDKQYVSYSITPDTNNSFTLSPDQMYSSQQLRAADVLKIIFGANGKRQVVAVDLKDGTFLRFLSECDAGYQAAQKAAADAARKQADEEARQAEAAAVHLRTYNKSADFEATVANGINGITYWPDLSDTGDSASKYDSDVGSGTMLRIQQIKQDHYGVDAFYSVIWSSDGAVRSGWIKAEDFDRYIGQERSADADAPPNGQSPQGPGPSNAPGAPAADQNSFSVPATVTEEQLNQTLVAAENRLRTAKEGEKVHLKIGDHEEFVFTSRGGGSGIYDMDYLIDGAQKERETNLSVNGDLGDPGNNWTLNTDIQRLRAAQGQVKDHSQAPSGGAQE